jgi:GNAT superfamily N-acetyltransferase
MTMAIEISAERPDRSDASALILELESELASTYAVESRHGYAVDTLIARGVEFFVARVDGAPAGCGGIELVGSEYGELKRMFVRPAFRRRGVSRALLAHLIGVARHRGVPIVRLETGIHQRAAIALYESAGFRRIRPFGPYFDDPVSRCYELALQATGNRVIE